MTAPTLVAIDFSPSSLAALDLALRLATKEGAPRLHLLHVVPVPTVPGGPGELILAPDLDQRIRGELERLLRETAAAHGGAGLAIETHLLVGAAATEIVAAARRHGCRRIALGTSRPGPLARVLLGSVSDRVVRTSPIDVVVVPAAAEGAAPRARIRNVVCATDFSAPAETALLHALEIGRSHDARLHLVHVWDAGPYAERWPDLVAAVERDARRDLELAAHRHEAPGVPILRHLRRGHPAEEIVRVATDVEADLLVVGTTGKRGVDHLLLGSVAERVARTSGSPVLVARG